MSIGVYGIFYKDLCLYVGQSINIEKRLKSHKSGLKSKTHARKELIGWLDSNSLIVNDLDFKLLETIDSRIQSELNLLEVKYFNLCQPMFSGQSPSIRNNYESLSNNPEVSITMGEKISQLIELSKAESGFRIEEGKRIWGRSCLFCKKEYDSFSPTGFYCSEECNNKFNQYAKICAICEDQFVAKNSKTRFCNECKYKVHEYHVKCFTCKKLFTSSKSFTKYCSIDCKKTKHIKCSSCSIDFISLGPSRCSDCIENKLWGCVCSDCGLGFQGSGPKEKYCSLKCGKIRKCRSCNKDFKKKSRSSTCSNECSLRLKSYAKSKVSKTTIEDLLSRGRTPKSIMDEFGVSKTTFYRIKNS